MAFIGFLLVAAALAAGAGVVLDNTGSTDLVVFGATVPGVSEQWHVFAAGAAVALVLFCGMQLILRGVARRLRARRDLRDLREEHQESITTLVAEKRRLERELAEARQGAGTAPPRPAGPSGPPRPAGPAGPSGNTGPLPRRRETAGAAQGTRVAPKNPGTSPFFSRND